MPKKKKHKSQAKPENLAFEEATNLTIEEAMQKEADLAAGVTPEDGVLDKYIKRNRDKVGEQKYINKDKVKDLSQMDTSSLDNFIQSKRRELETTKELATFSLDVSEETPVPPKPVQPVAPARADLTEVAELETFYDDQFLEEHTPTKRKWLIGALVALLLTSAGLVYGLSQLNKLSKLTTSPSSSAVSPSNSSSGSNSKRAKAEDVAAFDDLYKTFFADEGLSKPKNDAFDQLPELEKALNKLAGTTDHTAAKSKYDSLAKAISAIRAVNDKFETPAIVDGEKIAASLKPEATFDDLTTDVLNTGKASLDVLLQAVLTEARGLEPGASLTGGKLDKTAETSSPASSAPAETSASPLPSAPAPAASSTPAVQPTYGLTSYDASRLQRHLSRVPFNADLIADTANPAWIFNPGVMEEIIRVSQQRGYITGHEFILEPVNIINGNGYYNMYRPDGTYLFSINAKTGYFVGNGAGYADALDY